MHTRVSECTHAHTYASCTHTGTTACILSPSRAWCFRPWNLWAANAQVTQFLGQWVCLHASLRGSASPKRDVPCSPRGTYQDGEEMPMLCPLPPDPKFPNWRAELISATVARSQLKPTQKELCPSIRLRTGKGGWFRAKEPGFGSHSIRKCPSLSISLRFVQFMSYFEELKRERNLTPTLLASTSLSPV